MSGATYDGHGPGAHGNTDGHASGGGIQGGIGDAAGGGRGRTREEDLDDTSFVRPFIITGGRSEPLQANLRLETLVVAVGEPDDELAFEWRHIVAVCERPTTVAEVADRVGVPLGVAKVLISDLVAAGRLACRQPAELPLQMLERIRDHVRAL
ncbi:DUF742 domain-containing protein [Streptomyces sp. NPDC008150]|uniref:DUF742 domain-containing protein n=1 Tax=Streptomyces sp. NPDC008150 TaxID=3364816 RepID=UPI0036EF126B